MMKSRLKLASLLIFLVPLLACGGTPAPSDGGEGGSGGDSGGDGGVQSPAAQMLPDLGGYRTVEGETLTVFIGALSGGAALLAGRPDLAASISYVDSVVGCYQGKGALQARLYSKEGEPLSAGTVAIGDEAELTDPTNILQCVGLPALSRRSADSVQIDPCSHSYTIEKDSNTFYILYAGSTQEICRAFCSQLEGCEGH